MKSFAGCLLSSVEIVKRYGHIQGRNLVRIITFRNKRCAKTWGELGRHVVTESYPVVQGKVRSYIPVVLQIPFENIPRRSVIDDI